MTDKLDIDWYRNEHLRIVENVLSEIGNNARLKDQIIRKSAADADPATRHQDPAEWEEWLQDTDKNAFYTLKRLRFQANEIWAGGSPDPIAREKFTIAVETEYKLSIWAATQYLKTVKSDIPPLLDELEENHVRTCRICRW